MSTSGCIKHRRDSRKGHEDLRTVEHYRHADLVIKEKALARTTPPNTKPGHYRPPDPHLGLSRISVIMRNLSGRHSQRAPPTKAFSPALPVVPHNHRFRRMSLMKNFRIRLICYATSPRWRR